MKNYLNCWTPVEIKKSGSSFEACVWGRKYEFKNSLLPSQITSLGNELLYSPAKITPVFGDETGEWEDIFLSVFSEDEEKAVIVGSATCRNVILNTAVTIEYDGFVKIDLKLMSYWQFSLNNQSVPKLTGLYMDIPVKKEYASLMHYWPNDKTSIIPAADVMNSGKTKEASFPFKPYISLGNNEVGLGVFLGETTENFNLKNDDNCINITDKGSYINIHVNYLENMPENWQNRTDHWVCALKPVTYTLGFHATPVKPMRISDETYKIYHLGDCSYIQKDGDINSEFIKTLKNAGVKWLVLHENWTAIQNYAFPADKELTKRFIAECHKSGIKVMVYFGYEYSTLVPEWNKNAEQYLIKTTDNQFTGGWQRKPHQRAFMVCYNGEYSNEMISRVEYAMDELGADGIYTDGTYVPWECANLAHGCGYTDSNGIRHTTFPILAVREHVKKLYKTVHERNGIIDTHQSSCCIMPTLSFCDSYYDGENIQGMLKKDDMDFLNMDAFRAEYMGSNFGIPANFIAYTNENRPIQTLSALTLLHNVHCRPCGIHSQALKDIGYTSKIWKIFDEYSLNSAKWHPYWNNNLVTAEGEKAYASVYELNDFLIAVTADFSKGINKIGLNLPSGCKTAVNLLTGEEYTAENGKLTINSDMSTLNILLIK